VLPFAPSVPPEWLDKDPSVVRRESGVPENYFIICNQFWVHKDHKTAFIAFASLLSRLHGDDVALVCTGGLHDYRAPGHIDRLKELLLELKITERVYLLGHIAKSEQIALVRGAVAVIQPTLFEGGPGGGSIYDAVALGVPSIVSDIPVNREVDASNLSYFSPGDDAELARLMLNAMENRKASASVAELLLQGEKRLAKLGQTLDYAISATLN
jgi:glycosyltransferase involved in cell wall biosynthesis